MTRALKNIKSILTILCLCLTCIQLSLSQEITFQTIIDHKVGGGESPKFQDDMIQHNGKFYWFADNINQKVEWVFTELEFDVDVPPSLSPPGEIRSSILMEYTPGEGFTDYILFPYGDKQIEDVSFDGDSLLIWSISPVFAVNDSIIVGDLDSLINHDFSVIGSFPTRYMSFAIYDLGQDSIVDTYSTIYTNNYGIREVVLADEYAYVSTVSNTSFSFFGDTLDVFTPGDPYSSNTHISKLNLNTRKIEWTKHIGDSGGFPGPRDIDEIIFDEEGNLIVLFLNWDSSQFDGVFLDSVYGSHDITLYKVSPDGELVDHLRFNAPWDEPFRDYKLENDGSMNVYGITLGAQPIKVGLDSFYIESQSNASLAIRVNKDWELEWYKSFPGSAVIGAMNSTNSAESLMYVPILDSLQLGDTTIYNPDTNPFDQFVPSAILKYDADGNRLGEILTFGDRGSFLDLITLAEDKYLFIIEFGSYDPWEEGVQQFELAGNVFDLGFNSRIYFIEIEGDLFDIISALEHSQINDELKIYPSPVSRGDAVTVEVPEAIYGLDVKLMVHDNNGMLEMEQSVSKNENIIIIETSHLAKGLKRVTLSNKTNKITKSIIIF